MSFLRSLVLLPFIVFWTGICSLIIVVVLLIGIPKHALAAPIVKLWSKVLLFLSGVKLKITGLERLPVGGFLYVFNHTSHYDIPVIFYAVPIFPHFGAKSELFKIPIFGHAIRAMGALPIERKNRNKVMAIYKEAEKRVLKGDIFALAPEGTRQPGHGTLGAFKSGPFYFAINAKMPIVPIIISHCEDVIPKHSILVNRDRWIREVNLEFLEPISPAGYNDDNVQDLKDLVRDKMLKALKKYY